MGDQRVRPGVWLAAGVILAAAVAAVAVLEPRDRSSTPSTIEEQTTAFPLGAGQTAQAKVPPGRSQRTPAGAAAAAAPEVPYIEGLVYGDIDLREARELMPDNLYWKYGAPTKDEKVLADREEEKKRRNEQYGRVLSGDAGEDEVRDYYEYRRRLSSDYLEFAEFMQRRFRDSANEEFVGMLDLAVKLNAAKLRQLPSELEDALTRSRERARIREDWQRQQREFGELGRIGRADQAGDDRR